MQTAALSLFKQRLRLIGKAFHILSITVEHRGAESGAMLSHVSEGVVDELRRTVTNPCPNPSPRIL